MKQATLQRFFPSSKKNENQNSNQIAQSQKFEEEKIKSTPAKSQEQIEKQELNQMLSQKMKIQEEQPQKLSRLKRVIDSDDEDVQQNEEKLDSMKIENFGFEIPQQKKQEKQQEKKESTNQKVKQSVDTNEKQKKPKTTQKSSKSLNQSQKLEEEDAQNDNKLQGNTDFKNPNDKINVYEEFDDVTPKWAMKEFSKDKNGVPHTSPNADPTTLLIPQSDFSKLTKCMQQFWKYKSDNYDKIIFFKLGKFYELFYEDAYIGNKYLDLNWMGKKMHTGFPEKAVHKYKALLLEYGYKVVIVDQTETPEQMNARVAENKKSGVGNVDKIVQRSISEILTKGTYLYEEGEQQQQNLEERVLLVIRKKIISKNEEECGIAIFERQTNTISLAFIQNKDNNYDSLKTLLLHLRPVETVVDNNNIPSYDPIAKIIAGTVIKSVISYLGTTKDNWDDKKAIFRLEKQYDDQLPPAIRFYKSNQIVMQALNGLFSYLNQILILERVLGCARFKIYDEQFSLRQNMILDSQAIFHLEILQSAEFADKKDYSLFGVINKTTTAGGHRLLRRWVCAPLYQIDHIKERQQMVKDISRFRKERDLFRQSIKSFPDFERKCSRIYEYSVKIDSKAVFYENLSETRLKEFRQLTKMLRNAQQEIVYFANLKENFASQQLKKMLTFQEDDGLLPNVIGYLDEFEQFIIWEKEQPKPVNGVIEGYDKSVTEVEEFKQQLNDYLAQIKKTHFKNNNNLQFVHTKFRYEIEIPDELVSKFKPDEFEFTSQRQGYKRYITKKIKDLVVELEAAESEQKQQLTTFGNFIFKHFSQNQQIWDTLINILNELDVLCSLSVFGETYNGKMIWPNFISDKIKLEVREGKHPCLTQINFVPNSIDMGEKLSKFQLLTGPNMGGKSTILRMVCVLAILAQIGCQVPCEFMELSPIDRIFTRIGAKDFLMEGKSTFFVELEETLVPLRYGTEHSLFITDELGRGTSTYDGVAIASAVMKYLINKIQCRVLFATHFRILVEEAKLNKQITNVHMASFIQNSKVVFLYRLREGACEASFGINVAKVVGINEEIINKAQEMSAFFENNVQKNYEATLKQFNQILNQYEIN